MPTANELKMRIPGWGADLDPKNRPGVPKEKRPPHGTGAHWKEPEKQVPEVKILHSIEHKGLTPVFGSTCPPKGLSGLIREVAYQYSEGRTSHWLLLLLADRVDVLESSWVSLVKGQVHNPLKEMGLGVEWKQRGERLQRIGTGTLLLFGLGAGALLIKRASEKKAA